MKTLNFFTYLFLSSWPKENGKGLNLHLRGFLEVFSIISKLSRKSISQPRGIPNLLSFLYFFFFFCFFFSGTTHREKEKRNWGRENGKERVWGGWFCQWGRWGDREKWNDLNAPVIFPNFCFDRRIFCRFRAPESSSQGTRNFGTLFMQTALPGPSTVHSGAPQGNFGRPKVSPNFSFCWFFICFRPFSTLLWSKRSLLRTKLVASYFYHILKCV